MIGSQKEKASGERSLHIRDGHIFLHMDDMESARRFYLDVLGLAVEA